MRRQMDEELQVAPFECYRLPIGEYRPMYLYVLAYTDAFHILSVVYSSLRADMMLS